MAPAVNRLLPPASSSGARSSTSTDTPCSAADIAAHRAALPPPTTTTSAEAGSMSVELLFQSLAHTTRDRPASSRSHIQRNALSVPWLGCDPCNAWAVETGSDRSAPSPAHASAFGDEAARGPAPRQSVQRTVAPALGAGLVRITGGLARLIALALIERVGVEHVVVGAR